MKIRVPDYFKDFVCIASQCEDTCCAGWEVVIDDESYKKYQKVEGKFGEILRSEIVEDDEEYIFKLKGNNCPFLNESKLCDIYKEIGEDGLCYTCKQYPRYTEEFGNLREMGLSLSCPEVARIILRDNKKMKLETSENPEEVASYNDINGMLFINLLRCRKVFIDILQNREIDLNARASLLLKFADEIQMKIDEDDIDAIEVIREKYLDDSFINEVIMSLNTYKDEEGIKYQNIYEFIKVFKELKHIHPNDPLNLDELVRCFWQEDSEELYIGKHEAFNIYYEENMYKFEKLLVYFIFRYFMKGVFDYDVSAKVKLAVVSYLMIKELFVVRWLNNGEFTDADAVDIIHMYSKDIEHLEENLDSLGEIFNLNEVFDVEELLIMLSTN
ncbi:flagellin lysine-N-methylase [Oceanirhabdus sp. W0125-5]|uniref:flagellin lysine-N-methylase n=1 Tax=Oceanirhabdus sp. W0125-5 TaxID=2999116 RepID=UPI0022F3032E|nr:flagellin lysine-N-methylase [Oceanirhabdus sp. W0125-5]WBW96201.1 flagellin lysine-N-methylase [Oceanirhabdus sp. W0125-5]